MLVAHMQKNPSIWQKIYLSQTTKKRSRHILYFWNILVIFMREKGNRKILNTELLLWVPTLKISLFSEFMQLLVRQSIYIL